MGSCDGRKLSEAALNERRRRAVKMLVGGATIAVSAQQCELAERPVWAAVKAYRQGGWPAVKVRHGHRPQGAGRALSREQERPQLRCGKSKRPGQSGDNQRLPVRQYLILHGTRSLLLIKCVVPSYSCH